MDIEQNIIGNIKPLNKNLDMIKMHFSHCFDKHGNLDFKKLKRELSESEINFSKESYGMDWLGKSYARLLASDEATTLLKEDEEFNQKPENINSQNLLIKGDNLEVLKHLSNAYYEKVKMIYIDPPYNTGGDGFVYEDDRRFTAEKLSQLAGVDEEKAKKILDFTQSKSNSHSAWLTFMYPRLYIAKQLLKNDGVIFVSIDDNEVAQLRLLMDEIFGEENFVECICWNKRIPKNDKGVGNIHEYILLYVKDRSTKPIFTMYKSGLDDIDDLIEKLKKKNVSLKEAEQEIKKLYRKNGYDRGITLYNSFDENYRLWGKINMSWPNANTFGLKYEVLHPLTGKPVNIPDRGWRWIKSTFDKSANYANGEYQEIKKLHDGSVICGKIWFAADENTQPSSITYLDEVNTFLLRSILSFKSNGGIEVENLFEGKSYFSYPKPTQLLKVLFGSIMTTESELFLDFFAGSGTSGDAIMQLNSEDSGNRKYILVQLPELIEQKKGKTAYDFVKNELGVKEPTIFEITKERLIRAANNLNVKFESKIKTLKTKLQTEETQKELEALQHQITQNGFKIFETMPIWEDYDFEAVEYNPVQILFNEDKLTEEDIKALLVTWKTYDGIPLTTSLKQIDLAGYKAFYAQRKLYLADKGFQTKHLKALLEKVDSDKEFNPTSIIAFGYFFDSKSLREISENIKSYVNKKNIDIDFITRY